MSISTTLAEQVVSAIRIVAGVGPVPLHEQRFNGNECVVGMGLSVRHNQNDIVRFLVNNKL